MTLGATLTDSTMPAYSIELREQTMSDEDLAEAINNTLQNMWRSTRAAGLPVGHPVPTRINQAIAEWEPWWQEFKDGLLERQFDLGWGLWGTDWGVELRRWEQRVVELDRELNNLLAQTANERQQRDYQAGMADRGVDEQLQRFEADAASKSSRATGFLWGLVAVGGLVGVGLYLGRKRRGRRLF